MIDHSVKSDPDDIFPFAGLLDSEELAHLGRLVEWHRATAGDCLWREGDADDRIGLVVRGRVRLVRETEIAGHPLLLGRFGPGSLVIDFAFAEGLPRETSAYAVDDVEMVFLSRERFETILAERPHLGHCIFREALISFAEQLRHAHRRLAAFF